MKSLGVLGSEVRSLGINAEFESWTGKIPGCYWVYSYIISDINYETNCISGMLILEGFTRNNFEQLEIEKDKIIEKFIDFRKTVENTTVFFGTASAENVETQDIELKKIQINIDFKEWRNGL